MWKRRVIRQRHKAVGAMMVVIGGRRAVARGRPGRVVIYDPPFCLVRLEQAAKLCEPPT